MIALKEWADYAVTASGSAYSEELGLHLADGVLAWRAGRDSPEGSHLREWYSSTDPGPLGQAALCAALIRHTEMDDIHRGSGITPTAIALPALLPWIGGRTTDEIQDALSVGIELSVRVGASLGGVALFSQGQWPSLIAAPIGAAAALGRLLSLNTPQMTQALTMAVLQSIRSPGKTVGDHPGRWLMFAQSVRVGCLAAIAASNGLKADENLATAQLGAEHPWVIGREVSALSATSLKPYPSAKQALAAIEAVAGLDEMLPRDRDEIRKIEVFVPHAYVGMLQRESPETSRIARLVHGPWQLALQLEAPTSLHDLTRAPLPLDVAHRVRKLAARIEIIHDPALDPLYPRQWPARLVVHGSGFAKELLLSDVNGDPGTTVDKGWLRNKACQVLRSPIERDWVFTCIDSWKAPTVLEKLGAQVKQNL